MFQLKDYILEIYRTGSFSQAAANLYISQPSLSASVARLEKRIGEPLFDRSTHPIRLTPCGEAYLRSAQMITTAEDNFTAFLEEYGKCQTGALVLGGSNMNISFTLPKLIKQFRAAYPHIQVQVEEGNIDQLKQRLLEGKIDLVVDSCEVDEELFRNYPYAPENLLLAIPAEFSCNREFREYAMTREDVLVGKHLRQQKILPLEKVKDVPFVFPTPETDTYKRSMSLCKKAGFKPNIILSFHQQATVFHMNSAAMGAAFISDMLIKNAPSSPDMCYYKVGGSESFRHISFFKKKEKRVTPAMQAFLDMVRQEKNQFPNP